VEVSLIFFFSAIDRVIVQFGDGSEVSVKSGTPPTEYLFSFPTTSMNNNLINIDATTNPILLNGSYELTIGPVSSLVSIAPLDNITGSIAVAAHSESVIVSLKSGIGKTAPSQNFTMDNWCLNSLGEDGKIPNVTVPSDWMCGLMKENGLPCGCQVSYIGNINFYILTGDSNDYFRGINTKSSGINVNTAEGADTIIWENTDLTIASFDVGVGEDTITLVPPLCSTSLSLGDDQDADVVDVYAADLVPPPQFNGNTVGPLGPLPEDQLVLSYLRMQDLLYIRRGSPQKIKKNLFQISNDISHINVSSFGVTVRMDMEDNTIYSIDYLSDESVIVLDGQNQPLSPVTNWEVQVNLNYFDTAAYIWIWGVQGTNGTLTLNVPSLDESYTMQLIQSVGPESLGVIFLGGLQIKIQYADHIQINSKALINIDVQGSPSNADLIISAPESSTVNLGYLNNNIILVNTTTTISVDTLLSNNTIVSAGFGAFNILDCRFSQFVNFLDGCLTTYPPLKPINNLSNWFINNLKYLGISSEKVLKGCSLFTNQTRSLNVSASIISASGLDVMETTYELIVNNGDLFLNDSVSWSNVNITNTTLDVDNRYKVILNIQKTATVNCSLGPTSFISIYCEDSNDGFVDWTFGQDPIVVMWRGSSCGGMIGNIINSTNYRNQSSSISFTGNDSLSLIVNLFTSQENNTLRNISLDSNSLSSSEKFSYHNQTYLNLINFLLNQSLTTSIQMNINDSANEVNFNEYLYQFILAIGQLASANITTISSSSILFESTVSLSYNWSYHLITPELRNSNFTQCIQPHKQCTPQNYLDIAAHGGGTPCLTSDQEQNCLQNVGIKLYTSHSIECLITSDTSGYSIQVNPSVSHLEKGSYYSEWSFSFFQILYIFICIFSVLEHTFLGSNLGIILQNVWVNFVITAFLPSSNVLDYETLSFLQSANEVVSNWFGGWYCNSSIPNGEIFILDLLLGVCFVIVVLINIIEALVYCKTAENKSPGVPIFFAVLQNLLGAGSIFILTPYVVSHNVGALFGIGIAVSVMLVLSFSTISTWRRERPLDIFVNYSNWPGKFDYVEEKGNPKREEWSYYISVLLPFIMVITLAACGHTISSIPEISLFALSICCVIGMSISAIIRSLLFDDNTFQTRLISIIMFLLSMACGLAFVVLLYIRPTEKFNTFLALFLVWTLSPLFSAANPLIFKLATFNRNSSQQEEKVFLINRDKELGRL